MYQVSHLRCVMIWDKKDRKIKWSIADNNEDIFNPLFWASPLFSCCCNVSSVQRMCPTWCNSTLRLYLFAFYLMLLRKTFTTFFVCFPVFNLILLGVNFIMFIVYQPFSCLFSIETIEQGRTFFRIRFFLGRELVAARTFIFIPEISSINENQVLI